MLFTPLFWVLFPLYSECMYQTIHEPIAVVGVFDQAKFLPKKFRWGQRVVSVEQVTLLSKERDGLVPIHHYSVVSAGTLYRLSFHPQDITWFLEEVWYEGA